jgi:hypothetical protein
VSRAQTQWLRDLQDFLTSPSGVASTRHAVVQPATLRSTRYSFASTCGFVGRSDTRFNPTMEAFEDLEWWHVAYLRWLLGERQLQPVSVLNQMSAAASVHSFILATIRGVSQPQL